jgi:hypothetical protein
MATPKRVRYSDVAIFVDWPGHILSRVQSFSADTDKSVEEMRELSNDGITEYVEGLPVVSVAIDTSEIGSLTNLNYLSENAASNTYLNKDDFDGSSVDLFVHIEEDGVFARSMYLGDCYVTGISWGFDVGGVATENFTLETDVKRQYFSAMHEFYVMSGLYNDGIIDSGIIVKMPGATRNLDTEYTGIFATVDNEQIKCIEDFDSYTAGETIIPLLADADAAGHYAIIPSGTCVTLVNPVLTGGTRYRVGMYKSTSAASTITTTDLDSSAIGGIRKGMIEILVTSGDQAAVAADEMLRLQSVSIDVDMSREGLEELGNYKAYYRSLVLPIPVTVTMSALASDIDAWCRFAGSTEDQMVTDTDYEIDFRDFVKGSRLKVIIYDDDETNPSRNLLKTIVVQDMTVTAEAFGVDAGGNATQDFTLNADNFAVSGV